MKSNTKRNNRNQTQAKRRKSRLKYENLERRDLLTTFIVNSLADDASGVPDGFVSLREAIIAAETNAAFGDAAAGMTDGDVIRFDDSLGGQVINLTSGSFSITEDLAIFGGDLQITVDAGMADRAFDIDSSERVVIRGINISNGMVADDGGAILIAGSGSTVLNDVTFTSNTAQGTGGGGAVASTDNTVTIINSTFNGNVADSSTGSGGALLVNSGSVVVVDSAFRANVANRAGGAIEIVDGSIHIIDSILGGSSVADANIAGPVGSASPGNGGALHVTGMSGTSVILDNAVVENNVAASEGGGLWNQAGSTMLVVNSFIRDNVAMGDAADTGGGGIFNNGGTTRVRASVVNGNVAEGTSGSGGGFLSTDGILSIVDTQVNLNVANRAGGGIEIIDGELYVGDSTLDGNVAGPAGTASPGNGGAFHVTGTSGSVSSFVNTTVTNNFAAREGGGLWNQAGSSMFVFDSTITNNEAAGDGADDGGGGIFNNGGTTRIHTTLVDSNSATGTAGSGGGIFSTDGIFSASESIISANVANRAGGGIEVVDGTIVLDQSVLGGLTPAEGNIAGPAGTASPGNGGGLHVSGTNGTLTIVTGGHVSNNIAASEGGGLWNQVGSEMVVQEGAVIFDNTATGDSADNGGGGIFNNGGRLAILDATIADNFATGASGSGGGIFSTDGLVSVQDSEISGNVANRAGGGVELIDGTFLMFDSILGKAGSGNVAGPSGSASPGNGGGLHVTGTNGTFVGIDRSIVSFNTAGNEGGGLWNQSGSTLNVTNGTTISNNFAGAGGGGGLFNNGGVMNVFDSTITRNESSGNGGGIRALAGSETRINDSSLSFNTAVNGGGFSNDSQAFIRDSFFAFNEATTDGGGVFTETNGISDVADTGFFRNTPNNQR